jgi:phospholipid transport system substrate-binding protein
MKLIRSALLALVSLSIATSAFADEGAKPFVEKEHGKLTALLREPASGARDAALNKELDDLVDYTVLARRAFGDPCPVGLSSCKNHWAGFSDAQKSEVTELLKKLVQKNYKKNLMRTLDFAITFKSSAETAGGTKVRTEAKSTKNQRDPAVMVDYMVISEGGSFKVVDIITEGSSLTKNYYTQFDQFIQNPSQGYPHIVVKLKEKIAAK